MSARKLKRGLKFKGTRLSLYELNDRVWLLGSEVGGLIDRDAEYLMSKAPRLFTQKMTTMARISNPFAAPDKQPRGHKRRLFSIEGARLLAAISSTLAGTGLFYMLAQLDPQGKPKKDGSQ